jgi:hypothetical protein
MQAEILTQRQHTCAPTPSGLLQSAERWWASAWRPERCMSARKSAAAAPSSDASSPLSSAESCAVAVA